MKKEFKKCKLVIIIFIGMLISCTSNNQSITSNEKMFVLDKGDTIYLRSESWGLLGNSKTILIKDHKDKDFVYDSMKDYKIEDEEFIFLKTKSDSFIIYLEHKVKTPLNFNSSIRVIQVELNGSQFRDFFEDFKKIGVDKFH